MAALVLVITAAREPKPKMKRALPAVKLKVTCATCLFLENRADTQPKSVHFYTSASAKPQCVRAAPALCGHAQRAEVLLNAAPAPHGSRSARAALGRSLAPPGRGSGGGRGCQGSRWRPAPQPSPLRPPTGGSMPPGPAGPAGTAPGAAGGLRGGLVPPRLLEAAAPPSRPREPERAPAAGGDGRAKAARRCVPGAGGGPARVTPAPGRATAPSCYGRCRAAGAR